MFISKMNLLIFHEQSVVMHRDAFYLIIDFDFLNRLELFSSYKYYLRTHCIYEVHQLTFSKLSF